MIRLSVLALMLGIASAAAQPLPPKRPADPVIQAKGQLSPLDRQLYGKAFALAGQANWTAMELAVLPVADTRLLPVLEWLRLKSRHSDRNAAAYDRFIGAFGHFPHQETLRRRRESKVLLSQDDAVVGPFLAAQPPVTGEGRARLALLLKDAGASDVALALAKLAWREHDLDEETENALLAAFRRELTLGDHWARTDRLLWRNRASAARRMAPLVTAGQRRLIDARLRLRNRSPGVDKAVQTVPPSAEGDHGLIYERVRYRRRTGQSDAAVDLMLAVGPVGGDGKRWWLERRIQVRNLIKAGDYDKARRIAADHGLREGANFAQAEFEAGWVALRFLRQPKLALKHFQTLFANVGYPLSRSRGAYWIGRAQLALGDVPAAKQAFAEAAGHPLTYYGMLAQYELGRDRLDLSGSQRADPARAKALAQSPLGQLIPLLGEVGQGGQARVFLTHLIKSSTEPDALLTGGALARASGLDNLGVVAGKLAALKGVLLAGANFPVNAAPGAHGKLDRAMAHAIARQESAFDARAISRAGARGLMQLMPATAKIVARAENVAYSKARLIRDPKYNTLLGGAYLSDQIARFDGYLPFAAAAYNAGPHRVTRWLGDYGDPRDLSRDPVDWIEMIPFSETRNYVQRVMEGLQIYRVRLSGQPAGTQHLARDIGLKAPYLCQVPNAACQP